MDLVQSSWPIARAGEAMQAAAERAGLPLQRALCPPAPAAVKKGERNACRTWLESLASSFDLQLERKPVNFGAVLDIDWRGPALLQIALEGEMRVLALIGSGNGCLTIMPPDRRPVKVHSAELTEAIASFFRCEVGPALTSVLDEVNMPDPARSRIAHSMIAERLGERPIAALWQIGLPASAGLWAQLRYAGCSSILVAFISAYGLEYGLWIVSWILVGKWALAGRLEVAWLLGWALLLLTVIPLHMLALREQGKLAISCGWAMMRLLLEGSFKLEPEQVRRQGAGQLLGRVLESEALQSLALTGGLSAIVASIQLITTVALFAFGTKSWPLALALIAWTAFSVTLAVLYYRQRGDWTDARLELSQELIERMVGHRTRLVQQPPERWHEGEDECLAGYVQQSRRIDGLTVVIMTVLPRGWLPIAIGIMAHGLLTGTPSVGLAAAQLGGVLLAFTALTGVSSSLAALSGAAIAARRAGEMLLAARRKEETGDPAIAISIGEDASGSLIDLRDVSFRYPQRGTDAIQHSSLKIKEGDRILLEGVSGSGKSTWVGLVSGLRKPDSGLLLLRGIDRKTLGDRGWRRHVVASPQFHENHLLTGSLAFNLLLGRSWPPEPEDLAEAETICRELGLGPLLDSMPAGLMQTVGETGWQLSNGEKSRVFLARALLQRADLIVLDETLGGLDPETALQAIDCVMRRAPSLLCVAHV